MPTSIDSEADAEVGRSTEHQGWSNITLDEPMASRTTLARRLRAVERALGGVDGLEEFEPELERDSPPDDLIAVEERLDALERAVRSVGEYLVERDRARRTGNGIESVQQAVEALPESGTGTDTSDHSIAPPADRPQAASPRDESPSEWLERVAAGGVTPPPVE